MSVASGRWLLIAAGAATVATVATAVYLEPPSEARARRLDEQRARDLAAIEATVNEYWSRQKRLPPSLEAMASSGLRPPGTDPETRVPYGYTPSDANTYQLCATFALPSEEQRRGRGPAHDVQWSHRSGEQCFERTAGNRNR